MLIIFEKPPRIKHTQMLRNEISKLWVRFLHEKQTGRFSAATENGMNRWMFSVFFAPFFFVVENFLSEFHDDDLMYDWRSGAALSLADDELSQVRLREASQLLQRVILRHRQARDVRRQLCERDAERVGRCVALLQAQHHTQDVRHTLRHLCREEAGLN